MEADQSRPRSWCGAWLRIEETSAFARWSMHVSAQAHEALANPCTCLHGGDVMAVHKELCPDHAGGGAPVYEALVQHMMRGLN